MAELYIFASMKEMDIHIRVGVKQEPELTDAERLLVSEARRATYRSYSPYSHFSVGAAVELEDGTVVTGSNQENAAYPSGLCAERTAVFYANSRYPELAIKSICIVARGVDGDFCTRPITLRGLPAGAAGGGAACRAPYKNNALQYAEHLFCIVGQRLAAFEL